MSESGNSQFFICECGETFQNENLVRVHLERCHPRTQLKTTVRHLRKVPPPITEYKCGECGNIYPTEEECVSHQEIDHIPYMEELEYPEGDDVEDLIIPDVIIPSTSHDTSQDGLSSTLSTLPITSPVRVQSLPAKPHTPEYDYPESQPKPKRKNTYKYLGVQCETCGKKYGSDAALRYHQRVHTGDKPYKCPYCPKAFTMALFLQMTASDGLPPYACTICSALLVKSATFKRMCDYSQNLLQIAKMQHELSIEYVRSLKIATPFKYSHKNIEVITINFKDDQDIKLESDWEVGIDFKVKTESRESSVDSDRGEPLSNIVKNRRISAEPISKPDARKTRAETKKSFRTKSAASEKIKKTVEKEKKRKEKSPNKVVTKNKKVVKEKKIKNKKEKETGYEFPEGEVEVILLTKEQQIEEIQARKTTVNYLSSFYKCELCFKGFISESTYKNHMVRHDPSSGPLACEICHIRVADNKLLRSHMIQLHERKYVCKLCNNTSKSKHSASEHSKWHSGQKFTCKFCDAVFSKKTSHLSHMRLHHPSEHINCDVCGEAFIGQHGLRMHKKKAHKDVDMKAEPESETRCSNCKVQFQNVDAFKRHTSNINGLCDANLRPCAKCGECFTTELELKKHLKQHTKEERNKKRKMVKCEECNMTFTAARSYSIHYQQMHLRLPPATYPCLLRPALSICDVCGKKCSSAAALRNHLRIHTGELPFQCSECLKRFRVKERLKIHSRIHSGERPVKCGYCPKAFRHKAQLIRHIRVHTGEKPYPCTHCGKSFSLNYTLKTHIRTVHHMGAPGGAPSDAFYGAPAGI